LFEKKEKIKRYLLIAFAIISVYILYRIFNILAPFIISALLIYLLAPVVNFLANYKIAGKNISRGLSVIIIYVLVIGLFTMISMILFPLVYAEVVKIAADIPEQLNHFKNEKLPLLLSDFQHQLDIYGIQINIQEELDKAIESALHSGETYIKEVPKLVQKFIGSFFSALTSFIAVFIFTAFVLIDLPGIKNRLLAIIPSEYKPGIIDLANSINRDLNGAIRGQLIICVLNGLLTTLGMFALKVKFAVTIGLMAGVFSLIPVFGTIFSTIPAMLIASTQSWVMAIQVLVFILVIHLIEANLFNPKIMGTSVELHPAIIIFSIFVGEHLFGIPGLLLAVPVIAIVRSILMYIYTRFFMEDNSNTELLLEGSIMEEV
jgi:predicted PurR-regulated permease PerM